MHIIRSLFTSVARRFLHLWVKSTVVGFDKTSIDTSKPVFFVVPKRSFAVSLVVEQEIARSLNTSVYGKPEIEGEKLKNRLIYVSRPLGFIFRKRVIPFNHPTLKTLLEIGEQNPAFDAQIIPVSVFWGRAPEKEKSIFKIWLGDTWAVSGKLRTLFQVLFNGRSTFVEVSPPLNLREFINESEGGERSLRKIGRMLRVHFRHVRSATIGPDLSHRRTLVQSIVRKPLIKAAIAKEMADKKITYEKALAKAVKYGDEIASNQSHSTIRFLDIVLSWLWTKIYNGIQVHNLEKLKEVHKDNEIIYVPCHRSHIDYLLLSYLLFKNGFVPPQIAAGINLNMPVVGSILRRGGAFFMRRSFKDNPLYAAVFDEYLHSVFTGGYSTEYFVEGGRSRTGRTLAPKAGMLAMTVRSYLRDSHKPIIFMPVYIGYEKIFEGGTYLGELRGKKKKKESLLGLVKTIRDLKNNFGKVYVTFGDPINLTEFLNGKRPGWREEEQDADFRPAWSRDVTNELAVEVVTQINKAAALNPINMVALALLATPRQAMDERILSQTLNMYRDMALAFPYSHLTTLPDGEGQDWIAYAERMGAVQRTPHKLGDLITLDETQAVLLSYYRNNILHMFAVPSMLACLFISNSELKREDVIRFSKTIYPFLKSELFLYWDENDIEPAINKWLDIFIANGNLKEVGDSLKRPAVSSNDYIMLSVLSQSVIQILERYYIVISVLKTTGTDTLTKDDFVEYCSLMAQRISILHGLNAPEFSDKGLFRNLVDELLKRQMLRLENNKLVFGEGIEAIADDTKSLLNAELRRSILQVANNR